MAPKKRCAVFAVAVTLIHPRAMCSNILDAIGMTAGLNPKHTAHLECVMVAELALHDTASPFTGFRRVIR